jgi:hypothetical protein
MVLCFIHHRLLDRAPKTARVSHRRMLRIKLRVIAAAVCLAACSSYIAPVETNRAMGLLPFLIERTTTKEEVLNRLGTPVNEYEDGMIVSYILRKNLNSELQVGDTGFRRDWNSEIYNLVLVFGPMQTLEKYSLVRVR